MVSVGRQKEMKNYIITLVTLAMFSCLSSVNHALDNCSEYIYYPFIDSLGDNTLRKGIFLEEYADSLSLQLSKIEQCFNLSIDTCVLSKDTLHIKLSNPQMFTQSMGSFGANSFKASVVFTLTESDKINYVFFIYEEGDHGGPPGLLSRSSFKDWRLTQIIDD